MKLRTLAPLLALFFVETGLAQNPSLGSQAEIRRTTYGVPHIRAQNFKAAGYALGFVQMEDYGEFVPSLLQRARGELARVHGRDSIDADVRNRVNWLAATRGFPLLDRDTRDMYEGFAEAVNDYIRLHPEEFAAWVKPDYTAIDALVTDMELPSDRPLRRILRAEDDRGSNAWALAPSRTKSGKAILLRNPHLDWDAGYYEAQLTIPGVIDFYGDFRVGGPFQTIGGFNKHLGWSTTNNNPDNDEVYAIALDRSRPDHILFDGASIPLRREVLSIAYKDGDTIAYAPRELLYTPIGQVVKKTENQVYVWKYGGEGEFRLGQMWLRMMRARSLSEWKDAMRLLAKPSSNFTYADAVGHIFYVWYGQVPRLPVASGGDTTAVSVSRSDQVWSELFAFDSLPQLLNPKGGYIHNENDPFHYTNLNNVIDAKRFPPWFPQPDLGLRSTHGLQLISGKDKLSLEDVVLRKHSMRMLLADALKDDLIALVKTASPSEDARAAIELLERWDNTVSVDSRGSVLFENWWNRYARGNPHLVTRDWNAAEPMRLPGGIAEPRRAIDSFTAAIADVKQRYGAVDVSWGDVHRVRRGSVDVPVGGCSGQLGCFRVLWFEQAADGKRVATGGDGWVLAVEFGDTPRAYSVLAYSNSIKPTSPYFDQQAAMFARGEMKPVAFTEKDIERATICRYQPGPSAPRIRAAGNPVRSGTCDQD